MQLSCNTQELRGELRYKQTLQQMNTWKVGGVADCLYMPADIDDLSYFLKNCVNQEPITFLGLGSNILVRDGGVRGVILSVQGKLNKISCIAKNCVRVESGVTCSKLARYCAKQGLRGLEFLAGVPGTVGGALAMNAGANGSETWECVEMVETIDRNGQLRKRDVSDFGVFYRQVDMPGEEWFTAGRFRLEPGSNPEALRTHIQKLLKKRNEDQPIGEFNCGSIFKNPRNDYSAKLIEQCGLKGYKIGDAQVSAKHANFIVNCGYAKSNDIEKLILHIQETVEKETAIKLELEVKIIGDNQC